MAIKVNQHLISVFKCLTYKVMEEHKIKNVQINQKLYNEIIRIFDFKHGWKRTDSRHFQKEDLSGGKIIITAHYTEDFEGTGKSMVYFKWCWLDCKGKTIKSDSFNYVSPDDCTDMVAFYFENMLPTIKSVIFCGFNKVEEDAINNAWEHYGWY